MQSRIFSQGDKMQISDFTGKTISITVVEVLAQKGEIVYMEDKRGRVVNVRIAELELRRKKPLRVVLFALWGLATVYNLISLWAI